MTSFTSSGARRTGDDYQDFQSAEILVDWLEHPEKYSWVRLETMEGSLDDIQAGLCDNTGIFLQVKFGTNSVDGWTWKHLSEREKGVKAPKPSLLQKWKKSLDQLVAKGLKVREAALVTNRMADAVIQNHLQASGLIDFNALPESLRVELGNQLGGAPAALEFFKVFQFRFSQPSFDGLEAGLKLRFLRIGGTEAGWGNLLKSIKRWINRNNEPPPDGTIHLEDIRTAALWHLPSQIPQGFAIPSDYVPPAGWSGTHLEPLLEVTGKGLAVVTGSPGAGKSTYLSWLVRKLISQSQPVIRHHYFLSVADPTPYRSDWETAANALIGQLLSDWPELNLTAGSSNPLPQSLGTMLATAGATRAGKVPLVVVVDGLDHVWRDTNNESDLRRFFDLLLPVPDGVIVVVGTQSIDSSRLPLKLRSLCPVDQWRVIPGLDLLEVGKWLNHNLGDLRLTGNSDQIQWALAELRDAFFEISAGHPLILHYALNAATAAGAGPSPESVRALPSFDPSSSMASYYAGLWDSISALGHSLLHLLSGFPWSWPREGLLQCLGPQANPAELETAELAVRHVLGFSHSGISAFHESLLAFVRKRPEHQSTVGILRPLVLNWLTNQAPAYWRWRHEWEQLAANGDPGSLISSATLDWCVDSLLAGRTRSDIAKVLASSGRAALQSGALGIATERYYIESYLEEARHARETLAALLWLAFHQLEPRFVEQQLDLFLAGVSVATEEEIQSVSEAAFRLGYRSHCRELCDECGTRWNNVVRVADDRERKIPILQDVIPSLVGCRLEVPTEGPYQRSLSKDGKEPAWCTPDRYAKAIARLLVVGDETTAIRQELTFLANNHGESCFSAVDEVVRAACRQGFNPDNWLREPQSRTSELFRCYCYLVHGQVDSTGSPREVSFARVYSQEFGQDEILFSELARAYFFCCLARALEGRPVYEAVGVEAKGTHVVWFLSLLKDLALAASEESKTGEHLGGRWILENLSVMDQPEVRGNDFDNRLARRPQVARAVVAIAHDLEDLHYASTGSSSLTTDKLSKALDGTWTWERVWIEERVARRLPFRIKEVARLLIDREKDRLGRSRDYLYERAAEYVSLAQFCWLHEFPKHEIQELSRLAARNLLGHGYRKDVVLFDQLAAIRVAPNIGSKTRLERLECLCPIIQIIDEITDGSETRHLKGELAEVLIELEPEAVAPYVRALQFNHHHGEVEACFSRLAKSMPLTNFFEETLASTFVHEEALTFMQERKNAGDERAASVLDTILSNSGRLCADARKPDRGSSATTDSRDRQLPLVEDYPPERLEEFLQAVRDAGEFGDKHVAGWTDYWRPIEPCRLLSALTQFRDIHGRPHERKTGKLVVELASELSGTAAAWKWLIAYHDASVGWSHFFTDLHDVEWIWEFVELCHRGRWLEFVAETSRPRWTGLRSPGWSVSRMVKFLLKVRQIDKIGEVLDAACGWATALSANVLLPAASLKLDFPQLPRALRLLADRLDCPSRMVQECAAMGLAGLLAGDTSRETTTQAILDWHSFDRSEFRSCFLLLLLHLAHKAKGLGVSDCLSIIRNADLVSSIGSDLMLRDFGDGGRSLAETLEFKSGHSGEPSPAFRELKDFDNLVGTHLAPVFRIWASKFDEEGIEFTRQWHWESAGLMKEKVLDSKLNAHSVAHYGGHRGEKALPINDRVAAALRSSYLRAIHKKVKPLACPKGRLLARKVAVMAEIDLWATTPVARPIWWPAYFKAAKSVVALSTHVENVLKQHLSIRQSDEPEITIYAAGPVGFYGDWSVEIVVRSFLQSASGPLKPSSEQLARVPNPAYIWLRENRPFPGSLLETEEWAYFKRRDWLVAPLAGELWSDTWDWLRPQHHVRGVQVPLLWLFPRRPNMIAEDGQLRVELDGKMLARFDYWHDEIRERCYRNTFSRVGTHLALRKEWLDPHFRNGATLCWVVTLSLAQRNQDKSVFDPPQDVATWTFGGSQMVWTHPWQPPTNIRLR